MVLLSKKNLCESGVFFHELLRWIICGDTSKVQKHVLVLASLSISLQDLSTSMACMLSVCMGSSEF